MPAPSLFISRGNRGISPTFALHYYNLRNLRRPPPLAELKEGSAPPPSLPPPPAPSISPTASAMPPKPGKGKATKAVAAKAVKSTEAQRLEALRKERATSPPPPPRALREGAKGVVLSLLVDGDAGASAHKGTLCRRLASSSS